MELHSNPIVEDEDDEVGSGGGVCGGTVPSNGKRRVYNRAYP